MARPIRILLLGGDAALWVGLSSALGARSSQIVVPKDIDPEDLAVASKDIDVVVVVTKHAEPDPCAPLRLIREAQLERSTVVIANAADQRTAAEALGMGVGAYVLRGASAERVATAVTQVAEGGAFYDAPAAAVLHGADDARTIGGMMSAARALASALELKDTYTGGHAERVTLLAIRLRMPPCSRMRCRAKRSKRASCSTTSARSASPSRSSTSRGRSPTPNDAS